MKRTFLAVAITAVAVFSTVNLSKAAASKNIPVCHVPPGNFAAAHVINIDESALPAHIGEHCATITVQNITMLACDYRMDESATEQGLKPQDPFPCGVPVDKD